MTPTILEFILFRELHTLWQTCYSECIYCSIFNRDPGAMQMFSRVNVADLHSPEFEAHVVRVVNGLDILINFLDDRPSLEAAAKHLADQHAARPGVTAGYFQVLPVGQGIFPRTLSPEYDKRWGKTPWCILSPPWISYPPPL